MRALQDLLDPPETRVIVVDGSRDPNAAVTLLLCPDGVGAPQLAVKVPTTLVAADVVEREARVLVELQHRRLRRVEATIPRHLGMFDADGLPAAAASVLPGEPMRTRYHAFRHISRRAAVRADFAAASDWLALLHADSAGERAPARLLDGVPERIAARWPKDHVAPAVADRMAEVGRRLAACATPYTVVHGDFWVGNLLASRGSISGVIDWADGELAGEPLRDVARFALSYALYLDRHTRPGRRVAGHPGLCADTWGAGIRYALRGQGWFGELVRDFVGQALIRMGAPAGRWRDVLLAGLAEVAITADHPEFAARHRDLLADCLVS